MIRVAEIAAYLPIVLAAIGWYIASYFTLVYYGLVAANTSLMPRVCRLEEQTCQTVLNTRYARVFGVPNSLLGLLYYSIVIVILSCGWEGGPLGAVLIAVAWFTVALGFVLVYSLLFVIRIPCPLCLAGHTINLALAILLTFNLG
ncbi:MAG TPA: vitamin K epoxide reductase family protein [Blastocatellia bacterium]|nr:vitamin K epoxide reductase family protein [Blastocatellia bacterium]